MNSATLCVNSSAASMNGKWPTSGVRVRQSTPLTVAVVEFLPSTFGLSRARGDMIAQDSLRDGSKPMLGRVAQ
jgi:hypothetical protein